MEAIIVALIQGMFALVLYLLKRKESASATSPSVARPVRNRKPWLILGVVFWVMIGALVLMRATDVLLSTAVVIPVVSIPFAFVWPTNRHRAAALIFVAFAVTAAAEVASELTGIPSGNVDLTFSRGPSLPALWIAVSTVNAVVVWIICGLRERPV